MKLVTFKQTFVPLLGRYWIDSIDIPVEQYDTNKHYTKKDYSFIVTLSDLHSDKALYNDVMLLVSQGFTVIIDNTWERIDKNNLFSWLQAENVTILSNVKIDSLEHFNVIEVPRFFWFNEYLTCKYHGLDKLYSPRRDSKINRFLMPIARSRWSRRIAMDRLLKHDPVYSYVDQGKMLSIAQTETNLVVQIGNYNQRDFNSDWYDQTAFSVVCETNCDIADCDKELFDETASTETITYCEQRADLTSAPFITEKTFKPLAFSHPFMVLGQVQTLEFLRQNQFQTFSCVFDESYDNNPSFFERLNIIDNNIKQFTNSKLVEEICEYNRHQFYSTHVDQLIREDLLDPLNEAIYG